MTSSLFPIRTGRGAARAAAACLAAIAVGLFAGCAALPSQDQRTSTRALAPATDGTIGRAVTPAAEAHPGLSGIVPITDGRVAFGVRARLVQQASRSLDIQTFIWHDDATGTLLYDEVLRAAERGVRVRLLLDDANVSPRIESTLALLMTQPNIEVRIYNPFVNRGSKAWGFMTDFGRVNRRMHNKSFTVDNVITVVGGRNIADEYFEAGEQLGLVDLDVIGTGAVVKAVSDEFDLFWNSPSAYPARNILTAKPETRESLQARAEAVRHDPHAQRFVDAVRHTPLVEGLLDGTVRPEWTTARVIHDDPAKTLASGDATRYELLPQLEAAFGNPQKSLDLVSPYFVPGDAGDKVLSDMARRGVQVSVLTNSMASNDETSVLMGYSKARLPLLRAGVHLYELRPEAQEIKERAHEIGSSASAGLHAKTYSVDDQKIFVGSFNMDPRSSKLNTEMGVVIDSPGLAKRLSDAVHGSYPQIAYRLSLGPDGKVRWEDGSGTLYVHDPETGWATRAYVTFGSWLPIDWLL